MSLKCGIVGLPNVGKSTLFNAMTQTEAAEAANYPFCTIEPNIAKVPVMDERINKIADIANSIKTIHNTVEVVDIAGLVKGASKGEGLGNKFLSHIREVNVIIHVLRCFDDNDIKHVHGKVDPVYDAQTVEMELTLADIESLENKINKEKKNQELKAKLKKVIQNLENNDSLTDLNSTYADEISQLQLLSTKPILYVCNVEQENSAKGNSYTEKVKEIAKKSNRKIDIISAAIESEIAELTSDEDKKMFLNDIGLKEPGVNKIITSAHKLLNLITFFTAGPKETRAWSVRRGAKAPEAAGVIHTDFEKKFVKAETINYEDFIELKGEQNCKNVGKMRIEGKDYIVQDGDIMHFKHG